MSSKNETRQQARLDKSTLEKTRFIYGDITKGLDVSDKYDAILASRVLHFFSPAQLEAAVVNMKDLLKAGGRVYIIAITPYVKRFESFIPEYEKRVLSGEEFPGYVKSLNDWVSVRDTDAKQRAAMSPEPFMFLDAPVLTKLFKKHGYKIIACKTVSLIYNSPSWSLDGRENVVLIAEKIAD